MWALEHGLSSCGIWAVLLSNICDLRGPGIDPVYLALAGRESLNRWTTMYVLLPSSYTVS